MLCIAATIILAGAAAGDASSASRPIPFEPERMAYRREVGDLFEQGRFRELEERVASLRKGKDRFTSGSPKLYDFYRALNAPGDKPDGAKTVEYDRRLRDWQRQYPLSITPRAGLIALERQRAFIARGYRPSQEVAGEAWHGFEDHMKRAWDLSEGAGDTKEKDAYFYELLIDLCGAGGCPPGKAEKLFRSGVAIDPTNDHLYIAMANYLSPQWQGSVEEFTKFAERSAEESTQYPGDILYVRIVTTALFTEGKALPQHFGDLSWERIKRGLAALDERFPNSARTAHLRARFACSYGDRPVAEAAWKALGGPSWDDDASEVWFRRDAMLACYTATGGPKVEPR